MSHISKPVDWDILNIPPIQPVQYYSILKKKRELSQLIKQYDAQVFKHGYVHYCCIVPKNISSCLNNKLYEIYILFLNEISNTSFIGFRVKASKETFVHESNLLLLFLKKSKKAIFYLMNNNYIHVQCGINDAWELFYLLYDEYLRRYVLTIIGTQFFFSFTYSYCMQKEIQLLEMLYKGSKIIKVSRKSVYYKMHKKRKISVTDLIHMTYNMPKSKKFAVSCYNFKKFPVLYPDIKMKSYVTSRKKANELMFNTWKSKKTFHSFLHGCTKDSATFEEIPVPLASTVSNYTESLISKDESHKSSNQMKIYHHTLKRKFQDVECSEHEFLIPTTSTSKLFKSSESCLVKTDQWEKYSSLKHCTIGSYSDIPCLKNLVPKLLNDGSPQNISLYSANYYGCKNQSNTLIQNEIFSSVSSASNRDKEQVICAEPFAVNNTEKEYFEEKTNDSKSHITSKVHDMESFQIEPSESDVKIVDAHLTDNDVENSNEHNLDSLNDASFTTGAGKTINISNKAMHVANKLMKDIICEGKKIPCETSDLVCRSKVFKNENSSDDIGSVLKKRAANVEMSVSKTAGIHQFSKMRCLENNKTLGKPVTIFSGNTENVIQGYCDSVEDMGFTTAAGTNITVSDSAVQRAQKIMQEVFTEDTKQISDGAFRNGESSNMFQDVGCSSKKLITEGFDDVDMDGTLVEKFFEDTHFDEKELETVVGDASSKIFSTVVEPNNNQNPVARKVRKCLGGRRSLRYSDKL